MGPFCLVDSFGLLLEPLQVHMMMIHLLLLAHLGLTHLQAPLASPQLMVSQLATLFDQLLVTIL